MASGAAPELFAMVGGGRRPGLGAQANAARLVMEMGGPNTAERNWPRDKVCRGWIDPATLALGQRVLAGEGLLRIERQRAKRRPDGSYERPPLVTESLAPTEGPFGVAGERACAAAAEAAGWANALAVAVRRALYQPRHPSAGPQGDPRDAGADPEARALRAADAGAVAGRGGARARAEAQARSALDPADPQGDPQGDPAGRAAAAIAGALARAQGRSDADADAIAGALAGADADAIAGALAGADAGELAGAPWLGEVRGVNPATLLAVAEVLIEEYCATLDTALGLSINEIRRRIGNRPGAPATHRNTVRHALKVLRDFGLIAWDRLGRAIDLYGSELLPRTPPQHPVAAVGRAARRRAERDAAKAGAPLPAGVCRTDGCDNATDLDAQGRHYPSCRGCAFGDWRNLTPPASAHRPPAVVCDDCGGPDRYHFDGCPAYTAHQAEKARAEAQAQTDAHSAAEAQAQTEGGGTAGRFAVPMPAELRGMARRRPPPAKPPPGQ